MRVSEVLPGQSVRGATLERGQRADRKKWLLCAQLICSWYLIVKLPKGSSRHCRNMASLRFRHGRTGLTGDFREWAGRSMSSMKGRIPVTLLDVGSWLEPSSGHVPLPGNSVGSGSGGRVAVWAVWPSRSARTHHCSWSFLALGPRMPMSMPLRPRRQVTCGPVPARRTSARRRLSSCLRWTGPRSAMPMVQPRISLP